MDSFDIIFVFLSIPPKSFNFRAELLTDKLIMFADMGKSI